MTPNAVAPPSTLGRLTVLVLAVVVVSSVPFEAWAGSPGRNGRLVFAGGTFSRLDLRSILPDGSRTRRLTSTSKRLEGSPRWSPGGERIAFTGNMGGTFETEIFVMSGDGTRVRRLTQNETMDASPDWSPNGRRLVFIRGRHSRGLFTMRADGSHVRKIHYKGYVGYRVRWSPSGSRIAFEGGDDIFSIRLDGKGKRRITTDVTKKEPGSDGDTYGGIDGLDWSPDGRWILVAAHRGEGIPYVYKLSGRGGRMRRLTRGRDGTWSPNGKAIAFVRGQRRLVVKNLARKEERTVTRAREFVSSVAWQPR